MTVYSNISVDMIIWRQEKERRILFGTVSVVFPDGIQINKETSLISIEWLNIIHTNYVHMYTNTNNLSHTHTHTHTHTHKHANMHVHANPSKHTIIHTYHCLQTFPMCHAEELVRSSGTTLWTVCTCHKVLERHWHSARE